MSDARRQVEEYKKGMKSSPVEWLMLGAKYPENLEKMDFITQIRERQIARDKAVAAKIGVILDDFDTFYRHGEEANKEDAKKWAETLEDMPKKKSNYSYL